MYLYKHFWGLQNDYICFWSKCTDWMPVAIAQFQSHLLFLNFYEELLSSIYTCSFFIKIYFWINISLVSSMVIQQITSWLKYSILWFVTFHKLLIKIRVIFHLNLRHYKTKNQIIKWIKRYRLNSKKNVVFY